MPQVSIPIEQLSVTAHEFARASADTAAIRGRLDKHMAGLAHNWDDTNRQKFFQYYRELGDQLNACTEMLTLIAREMQAMADRYQAIDHG